MNEDIFKGQWKQIRGRAREWWGQLTDDDLDKINGQRELLIGKLQEKYGYARDEAVEEINERLDELKHMPERTQ